MKKINAETSRYPEIYFGLFNELIYGVPQIEYGSFIFDNRKYEASSLVIGPTSEMLRDMGFAPTLVYDREHFGTAMYAEGKMDHSHDISVEAIRRLPELLNNPLAIVSEDIDERKKGNHRRLQFLMTSVENGETKYYRAIVQPQDYHNGVLKFGLASKVVSFHEVKEGKFRAILDAAVDGYRKLLHFDNGQYQNSGILIKDPWLMNKGSFSISIQGSYEHDESIDKKIRSHQIALRNAVTAELRYSIQGKKVHGSRVQLIKDAISDLKQDGLSLKEYAIARKTLYQMSKLTSDQALRRETQQMADRLFAMAYIRHIDQGDFINKAMDRTDSIDVQSQQDLNQLCDTIEDILKKLPTLENLGVDVSKLAISNTLAEQMQQKSNGLRDDVTECMKDILIEQIEYLRDEKELDVHVPSFVED